MRLCAHVRLYLVSPNTKMGTGFIEHISRLRICHRCENLLHTQQAKALMLSPPIGNFGEFGKGTVSQCFSCIFRHKTLAGIRVQKYE